MRDIDAMIADAQKRAAQQFERQPRAAVVARPFPRFREAIAAGSYAAPSPDGSAPFVDTGDLANADCDPSQVVGAP